MLTEPLIQQLQDQRLRGMAAALAQQTDSRDSTTLPFDEHLSLLIQHEITERASARLAQGLRWARLPITAVLEDLPSPSSGAAAPMRSSPAWAVWHEL